MNGKKSFPPEYRIICIALILYAVWVIATWLLEGRILTLLRPEAVTERIAYTVVANIIIGIFLALWVIKKGLASKDVTCESTGFCPLPRTVITVVIG